MNMRLNAVLAQQCGKLIGNCLEHITAILFQFAEPLVNQIAAFNVHLGKGEVFQLFPKILHADAPGQRRVNIQRLLRDAAAFFLR